MANCTGIAGHVHIADRVITSGMVGVHQFVRLGRLAMLSGGTMAPQDVPPFCTAQGERARLVGLNIVGMRRAGMKRDEIMAFCEIEDLGASAEMIVFPKTLAIFSELVAVGTALFIKGRVSLKDDEIKIIPDSLALASDSEKAEISTPNEEKQSETKKKKRVGIFIKTAKSDEKKRKKAETLISIFSGNFPVYFYITEEKRYEFAGERLLTSPNEPMLKELKHIFGDENVVFRS